MYGLWFNMCGDGSSLMEHLGLSVCVRFCACVCVCVAKAGHCWTEPTDAVGVIVSSSPVMLSDCTIADYEVVLSQTQALSCSHRNLGRRKHGEAKESLFEWPSRYQYPIGSLKYGHPSSLCLPSRCTAISFPSCLVEVLMTWRHMLCDTWREGGSSG